MIVNIIGECDKRAVLYTTMKMLQTLGDVLVVSSSSRLLRLSNTHDSGGHYQNVMICITQDGLDDFFSKFGHSLSDFEHIIVDNIISAEADAYIYVEGLEPTEQEVESLEYIDSYASIPLYKKRMLDRDVIYRLEQFESFRDMCPISKTVATEVAKILAPVLNTSVDNLVKIGTAYPTANKGAKPQPKGVKVNKTFSLLGRGNKH